MGDSMENVGWVIHRLWRNRRFVKRMVETKALARAARTTPSARGRSTICSRSAPQTKRSQIMDQRLAAEGYASTSARDEQPARGLGVPRRPAGHHRCSTAPSPSRPARTPPARPGSRFRSTGRRSSAAASSGISEVEPIQHLQYEINTLRSQRRDAATLALDAHLRLQRDGDRRRRPRLRPGPGDPRQRRPARVPVPDPRARAAGLLLPGGERHQSTTSQRTSGISDPVTGGDAGASETATGVQLVQAAATMRIQNKTRLLENQIIVPQGYEFINLNQRRILTARDYFDPREPEPQRPDRPGVEDGQGQPARADGPDGGRGRRRIDRPGERPPAAPGRAAVLRALPTTRARRRRSCCSGASS